MAKFSGPRSEFLKDRTVASRTVFVQGRNLPENTETFVFAGIDPVAAHTDPWISPGAIGGLTNEAWGQLDLRAQYTRRIHRVSAEVFVDLFNVTDSQSTIRNQDLLAGQGGVAFGDGLPAWLPGAGFARR